MKRVFLEGKDGFRDQTDSVMYVPTRGDDGRYEVIFRKNPQRTYRYGFEKVAIAEARRVPMDEDAVYTHKGRALYDPIAMTSLVSDNVRFEERVEVEFGNGSRRVYRKADLKKCAKAKASSRFGYLQAVAEAIRPDDDDPNIRDYLTRQYEELADAPLEGLAASYLTDPRSSRRDRGADVGAVIYPFGSNLSQMEAVEAALTHGISIIEGPPGTGKTQTVLNIIANLLMRGDTVLMVSPNNEATKNVADKLRAYGFGFLVAALGKKENVDLFLAEQCEIGALPESFMTWKITGREEDDLERKIASLGRWLKEAYRIEQDLFRMREESRSIRLEHERFSAKANVEPIAHRRGASSKRLSKVREEVSRCADAGRSVPWFDRIRYAYLWGVGSYEDYVHPDVETELRVGEALYRKKEKELGVAIGRMEGELARGDKDGIAKELRECSLKLFQARLYDRYGSSMEARETFDDVWEEADALRWSYPVITSTTNAARKQMGKGRKPFDYVIVDESSQADLVTGFLALTAARNAVIVGDSKQLPCVITEKAKEAVSQLILTERPPDHFDYVRNSLLDCVRKCARSEGLGAPISVLREHYRCHPDIIGFCNQQFYDGELIVMTAASSSDDALSYRLSSEGNHDREADFNRVQREMLVVEAVPDLLGRFLPSDIGVVSPYRRQVDAMKRDDALSEGIVVDTVHKFQGREKEAMVFVVGANDANAFVDDPRLVNVAVSRAKSSLCLVTAPGVVEGEGNLADLKRYISYHGGIGYESEVSPAFPLLYASESERRRYLLEHGKSAEDQYSEVRMEEFVREALSTVFAGWGIGYCRNYPLKLLCRSAVDLTEAEKRFVSHSAHADFVFFRSVDNSVFLEYEVNGAWHYGDERQRERDALKRSVLAKLGIAQREIRTNETRRAVQEAIRKDIADALASGDATGAMRDHRSIVPVVVSLPDAPWSE